MLTKAQESQTAYNFLRLPVSAHVAALGGNNIAITDVQDIVRTLP